MNPVGSRFNRVVCKFQGMYSASSKILSLDNQNVGHYISGAKDKDLNLFIYGENKICPLETENPEKGWLWRRRASCK